MKRNFSKDVFQTIATKGILLLVGVIPSILTARILGPAGKGLLASALAFGTTAAQASYVGIYSANVFLAASKKEWVPSLYGNTLLFGGIVSFLTASIAFFASDILPTGMRILVFAFVPFAVLGTELLGIVLGLQKVSTYNRTRLAVQAASAVAVVLLAFFGALTPLTAFSVTVFLQAAVFLVYLKEVGERPRVSLAVFKETVKYGFKAYLTALASYLVLKLDILMLSFMTAKELVGIYSVTAALFNLLSSFSSELGSILFPRLSFLEEDFRRWRTTLLSAGLSFFGTASMAGALLFFRKEVVSLLFGKSFLMAADILPWLMPGLLFLSLELSFKMYLISDREKGFRTEIVLAWCGAAVLNALLNWKLISLFGLKGAALASTISLSLASLAAVFLAVKEKVSKVKK